MAKKTSTTKTNEPLAVKNDENLFNSEGQLVADVFETPEHFVVLATIAGVQIKDLDISVEEDMMVIKGNRANPHDEPNKTYLYQECYFGPFSRKIVLPENIHTQKAFAEMKQGILTVKIPKKSKAPGKEKNIEDAAPQEEVKES